MVDPLRILGYGQTHNASACLLIDGEVIACASEERFNRTKNATEFPAHSIDYVLSEAGLTERDLVAVAHSYRHHVPDFAVKNQRLSSGISASLETTRRLVNTALVRVPSMEPIFRRIYRTVYRATFPAYERRFRTASASRLGVTEARIVAVDHHKSHAYAGYGGFYLTKQTWGVPALVLTLDAEGDNKCATVSTGTRGKLQLRAATPGGRSIGVLYAAVTQWLGMKVNEHEYKVMGLAPYAPPSMVSEVEADLEQLIWVDGLVFRSAVNSGAFPIVLRRLLEGRRFDAVAGAIQRLLERRVVEWVRNAVHAFGINHIVVSGGVFMNVKANKAIMEMPETKSLTVCPSAADESSPIGAAWAIYSNLLRGRVGVTRERAPSLYWGPSFSSEAIEAALSDHQAHKRYSVRRIDLKQEGMEIATLLRAGHVVARMAGRMEFGARALGNRSILADPSRPELVRILNEQVKGRDFWMPFACTLLEEECHRYIVNPKRIASPYMMLAFDTTAEGRRALAGGIHPYDFSIRPQILQASDNPRYHEILTCFHRLTGIGGVLNTSFNLHGEPIVCTPTDALDVFDRSGLQYLQLEDWLIEK